jgi:hypothetical protein
MAEDVDPQEREANAAVIVDEVPPSSWGPYSTVESQQATGVGTWSWLVWIAVALGVAIVVAGVALLLANREVIFSRGEPSV